MCLSLQEVRNVGKGELNAEYYHETQSCRVHLKTYGLEKALLQHRFLFQDVNCIEKSAINANNGGKDEAIVFTMRRGGKTYVFGQVATQSSHKHLNERNISKQLLCKVSDRDFVVEKLCELLSRLSGTGEDSSSITSSASSTAFSTGWALGHITELVTIHNFVLRGSVDTMGSPKKSDGNGMTWEPCEPLMNVYREKVAIVIDLRKIISTQLRTFLTHFLP